MTAPATPEQWADLEVRRKLAAAARPSDHYVNLGPPQGSADLAQRFGQLPDDLAYFLDAIGSGIAPSGYNGLHPPCKMSKDSDPERPFPFVDSVEDEAVAPHYKTGNSPFHGTLAIASLGCGYSAMVVLTGAAHGAVFHDYTAADSGIARVADSFFEWYESCVDDVLREVLRNQILTATEQRPPPRIADHAWLERWPHLYAKWSGPYTDDYVLAALYLGDPALARQRVTELEAAGAEVMPWVKSRLS